ncbi:uncharacterized protein BKA78DRAFT_313307 [Phyllosticta capitalensis]|uniref:uncharacterized protein n=1 Tax=Phyllosticta capitalensis TaxID=121624 RepID=UPI00312FF134
MMHTWMHCKPPPRVTTTHACLPAFSPVPAVLSVANKPAANPSPSSQSRRRTANPILIHQSRLPLLPHARSGSLGLVQARSNLQHRHRLLIHDRRTNPLAVAELLHDDHTAQDFAL